MIEYNRGDIALVDFILSDETGIKRRPALIVSSNTYHQGHQEVIIAAITSRTDRVLAGDHLITKWKEAGLPFPSVATGIIRTIKAEYESQETGI
jgi:mRNA interferase MazF